LEEYATLLTAAKALDPMWYAACCLAGEAGLRVGEIRALDWKRDVDLVAGTITVNRQTRRGEMTTPKGRTRRTIPMTDTLLAALKALDTIRTGFVIRNLDGSGMTDNETKYHCYRICRVAGLEERGWHNLRHNTESSIIRRAGLDVTMLFGGAQAARLEARHYPAGSARAKRGAPVVLG
jgi:integrase